MHQIIESPVHGVIEVKRVPNPKNLDWGSISILKNDSQITMAWAFKGHEDKRATLFIANNMILKRKDRYNKYDVQVLYGVNVREHISRNVQKSQSI